MLTPDQMAYLKSLARRGDMEAHALLYAMVSETNIGSAHHLALVNPAAKDLVSIHDATLYGDAALDSGQTYTTFTAGLANPTIPRNLRCVFGHTWDGGNVTVNGTDQFDAPISEDFTAAIDSTVVGVKVFKTVTSVVKKALGVGTHATNTLSIGTGDKLGLGVAVTSPFGQCRLETGAEDAIIIDVANSGFTPTTVPNGAHDYDVLVYVNEDYAP